MFAEIDKTAFQTLPVALVGSGNLPKQGPIERPYGMECHQFLWVTRGSGTFTAQGETFTLEEGEGFFVRAGVPHAYRGEALSTAWFTFTMPPRTLDYLGVGQWLRFRTPSFLPGERATLEQFACGESTPLSRSVSTYALIAEIVSVVLPVANTLEGRVLRYLEAHYAEPLTLEEIAAHVGTDRFGLCHNYRKKRGRTVMEDLNAIRIAKAKRFLCYSTETVERIGKMCGFENASYFSKRFREECGKTPGQYRQAKAEKAGRGG